MQMLIQTFGWTPAEAKLHMVGDYFSQPEVLSIEEILAICMFCDHKTICLKKFMFSYKLYEM